MEKALILNYIVSLLFILPILSNRMWHDISLKLLDNEDIKEVMINKNITVRLFSILFLLIPYVSLSVLTLSTIASIWKRKII